MGWVRSRGDGYQAGYRTPAGDQVTDTFRLKRDAQAWVTAAEDAKRRGQWTDPRRGRMPLDTFYTSVFLPTQVGLARNTTINDTSTWRCHIEPAFGQRRIGSIEHAEVQAFLNELATRRGPSVVLRARTLLGKILTSAVRSRYIGFNPCDGVSFVRADETEVLFMTPAQVSELAADMTLDFPAYEALIWLGCYCGPRIGELVALEWDDVDLVHRRLHVERQHSGRLKTKAARRSVPIPKLVVAKLEEHLSASNGMSLVFPAPRGGKLPANTFRDRMWRKAVKGWDPKPTPHDMRHTAVSLWISQGASDMQIAAWAGHKSSTFTKAKYGHLFPEHGDEMSDRLDALIESNTSTPAAKIVRIAE